MKTLKKLIRKIPKPFRATVRRAYRKVVHEEPVRALSGFVAAGIAALAAFGVTDGPVVLTLGEILVVLGGGQGARAKVTPTAKPRLRG